MKKVDSIEKLKKFELISHIADLVKKYDALEKEHKEKININKSLKAQIVHVEKSSNSTKLIQTIT